MRIRHDFFNLIKNKTIDTDMCKITVVECTNCHINSYNSSNFVLKFRIVASKGQIHREEGEEIEIKNYFLYIFLLRN